MASTPFEPKGKTVFVAGDRIMVRAAIMRQLSAENVDILSARLTALGWRARTALEDGITLAYRAFLAESRQAAE